MKKKINYTDHPIYAKVVKDFLPKPEDLVAKEDETVKITMQVKKSSVEFFKKEAKRLGGSYQAMIRNLLDQYTNRHAR